MSLPPDDRSEDNALALSSAVGRRIDQPLCRAFCAAICTVLMTPTLLARETTLCFRFVTNGLPGFRPRSSVFSTWDMAACN